jgi:hypothetical protein
MSSSSASRHVFRSAEAGATGISAPVRCRGQRAEPEITLPNSFQVVPSNFANCMSLIGAKSVGRSRDGYARQQHRNVSVLQRHRTRRRVYRPTRMVAKQTVRQPPMMMQRMHDGEGRGGRRRQRQ